ncbi:MAG: GSCFA domain-containing protein [Rikenellaceae bacterium]
MKFRTEIQIDLSAHQIDYSSEILSLGSCFALSIGERLCEAKFKTCVNPVGVLFNPLSISSTIERLSDCRGVDISELQKGRSGEWFHFDFHGSLSDVDPQVTLSNMNSAVSAGSKALAMCDTIIITLGTVWVYELIDSGDVVANCHKEPSSRFVRRAMSVDEVVTLLEAQVRRYPSKHFIFSVSPVRHLADGLAENSLSKATLRVALSKVVEREPNASYFAAYETLIDDLRDYRFYADDMLHPSPQAIDYIWDKFCGSNISVSERGLMSEVMAIVRAASHRPLNPASEAHLKFCQKQLEVIKKYPNIDFGKEYAYFMSQLQNNL